MLVQAYSFVNEIIFKTIFQDFLRKIEYIYILRKDGVLRTPSFAFPSPGSRLLLYILLYRNNCLELIAVDLNIKFSSQRFRIGTYDCKPQSVTITGSCLVTS